MTNRAAVQARDLDLGAIPDGPAKTAGIGGRDGRGERDDRAPRD